AQSAPGSKCHCCGPQCFVVIGQAVSNQPLAVFLVDVRVDLLFRFCQENKDLTRLLFWDAEVIDEELKEWAMETRREKEQRLHGMISAAISAGEIRDFDPQFLTVIIGGVFGAIWAPVVVDGWDVDAAEAARQITDLIMGGLRP
ncbi:MAG: hypothetical protein GYA42_05275, partial [Syntrophomonadaceae bacterium]|nr:hypothetical protein [Syntrophomonadaceae bacterium]